MEYVKDINKYPEDEIEDEINYDKKEDKLLDYFKIIYERPRRDGLEPEVRWKCPEDIPIESRVSYHYCRIGHDHFQLLTEYNNIEGNMKYLNRLMLVFNFLKKEYGYLDKDILFSHELSILRFSAKALKQGYLITKQLEYALYGYEMILKELSGNKLEAVWEWRAYPTNIDGKGEDAFNFEAFKKKIREIVEIKLDFSGFIINEEEIFTLIRKNERWLDLERDLIIYRERKKGKYLQDLADNFGIKYNSVSMVDKKVSGAVSYWKGKKFEDFVYKRLKKSGLFEKVIKEAGKGEADILAYAKDGKELYIYSIKNLKINRKPYWLTKEELRTEVERAVLQGLDYKVHLILLVFDNFHDIVKQFKIDYNNPRNINISK